jgi:hypothetical protein
MRCVDDNLSTFSGLAEAIGTARIQKAYQYKPTIIKVRATRKTPIFLACRYQGDPAKTNDVPRLQVRFSRFLPDSGAIKLITIKLTIHMQVSMAAIMVKCILNRPALTKYRQTKQKR